MSDFLPYYPTNGKPTTSEVFRMFRQTTMAAISGLKLLLEECAELRAELVIVHREVGDGEAPFRVRQENRILELKSAAQDMSDLLGSVPERG